MNDKYSKRIKDAGKRRRDSLRGRWYNDEELGNRENDSRIVAIMDILDEINERLERLERLKDAELV